MGRKYAERFKEKKRILFDAFLPKWNYRVVPATPWKSGRLFPC